MAKEKKQEEKDPQTKYKELLEQLKIQKEKSAFASYNIKNLTEMILIPHYTAEAEMRWQQEYPRDSEEFKQHVADDINTASTWIKTYVDHRLNLETRRPYNNPEDPAWDVLESDIRFIEQYYPDIPKNLGTDTDNLCQAELEIYKIKAEISGMDIIDTTPPEPDASKEIAKVEETVEENIEEATTTPDPEGHTYPVATVKSWTNELKNYNKQLQGYVEMFQAINLSFVDRHWLEKQVIKFIAWLKEKLAMLRKKIISGLKGMMQPIKKALNLIKPVTEPPSLDTIVTWASSVLSVFMEPYMKVVQFVDDFSTYTPPLMTEAGLLTLQVATLPSTINSKVQELEGEGADIIKDEIANAISGVAFEPPTMEDVTG